MASSTRKELQPPGIGPFRSSSQDERRKWSHQVLKDYLTPDNGRSVLAQLGYSPSQQSYVSEVIAFLSLQQVPTSRGLEGRPWGDTQQRGPSISVESPRPGIAELTANPPTNLEWHARTERTGMTSEEISTLKGLGYPLRLYLLTPEEALGEDDQDKYIRTLHSSEQFPRFGLLPENFINRLLTIIKQAATYTTWINDENGDMHVEITNPPRGRRSEVWRTLPPTEHGLLIVGRVAAKTI